MVTEAGEQLTLVPLTGESIRALALRPDEPLSQPGVQGARWPAEDRRVLRYRDEALTADPAAWQWLLHAAVDREGCVLGRIGCHAAPVDGRVEVGYFVRPDARGRGMAGRLLGQFLRWLADHGVDTVVLSVAPRNAASLALVQRFGFLPAGEREDEEDGVELVFERRL